MAISMLRTARWPFWIICFLLVLFLLTGIIFLSMKYQMHQAKKQFQQRYENVIVPLMPEAIQNLKQNMNDWLFCTELGLSLAEQQDSPAVLAAWIAYYQMGARYCKQWWQWPTSKCAFLRGQRKSTVTTQLPLLERKIALCDIADLRRQSE